MKEELKTLKDFEYGGMDGADMTKYALREEAKKWITELETKIKEKEGQLENFGIDSEKAIIGFIKHFFNLEDEKDG